MARAPGAERISGFGLAPAGKADESAGNLMKPYFCDCHHLFAVNWPFLAGFVCRLIHGVASGAGVPLPISQMLDDGQLAI